MPKLPLKRPSAPMTVSVAALVVALGGTSYAATQIQTKDIANNAVTSNKIKDGSIKPRDLNARLFKSDPVEGPEGPQGPAGPEGPAGPAGVGRWALVEADGTISAQSGGFTMVAAYPTLPNTAVAPAPDNSLRAAGNVYINAGEDLSNNAIFAVVALQNTVDQNGDGVTNGRAAAADANPEFSGEISVSRCNFTGGAGIPTNCAPADAQNAQSFVVSPRNSDGTVTTNTARKRFYVVIAGDSSDYTPAP
ncbi:hypothetical protein [Nocardioides sp. R-C-SC26]|uniref:hypothetical protein n=1 Tax=Nocardioides sp. R-C-SC26 TaxID=2870414 RepID=UPI001E64E183|nr:hypothetical protein [Nocardioides sp. R-C-SC26]